MMDDSDPRQFVRALFEIGVQAADPAAAVHSALVSCPLQGQGAGRQFVLAVGKAACAMTEAALTHVPKEAQVAALAVTNYENVRDVRGSVVMGAGHPIPDENGLRAGEAVIEMLQATGPEDHVLFLVSGGGSSLLPAPVPGITLADKIRVNELLIKSGVAISETNLVRQQLSLLKGGGMARLASPAKGRTLVVSDVIGDDTRAIASGPTASPLGSREDAVQLLKQSDLWPKLPDAVQRVLSEREPQPLALEENSDISVICSNRISLDAMVVAAPDWDPEVVSDSLCGDVEDASRDIVSAVDRARGRGKKMLIWGGETTVRVRGSGKGGRNQELALRVAKEARSIPGDWVFLAGGTDGRDGPTDAAGGVVDGGTIRRIQDSGGDPVQLLALNDSYAALQAAGDLLITGPTGTNVADIGVFLLR